MEFRKNRKIKKNYNKVMKYEIAKYQLLTKIPLAILVELFGYFVYYLLSSTGRVAITSSDFLFLFQTWQGWMIILTLFFVACIYIAFDINTKIIYSDHFIQGKKESVWSVFETSFEKMLKFINVRGFFVFVFVTLLVPLTGFGFSISLTNQLYIPNFVTEVIYENKLYTLAYVGVIGIFTLIAAFEIYLIPIVLLEDKTVKEASHKSIQMIKEHGLYIYGKLIHYVLVHQVLKLILVTLMIYAIPTVILEYLTLSHLWLRFFRILIAISAGLYIFYQIMLIGPSCIVRLLELYLECENIPRNAPYYKPPRFRWLRNLIVGLCVIALSVLCTYEFDLIFPKTSKVEIIAHRAGGNLDCENTMNDLNKALEKNVYGSEIDIQRTKDGKYIVLHDSTFKRLCGVDKKPSEMTFSEIQKLSVSDGKHEVTKIATLDEMLNAIKGKEKLFIELKGETADQKMADDVVQIIKEKQMVQDVALISLKYDLVSYIETQNPDIETGFLYYASWGDDVDLNVDDLIMEEESASDQTIDSIHQKGKKAIVWTVDDEDSINHFLLSECDAIITNEVDETLEMKKDIDHRGDSQRILDEVAQFIS